MENKKLIDGWFSENDMKSYNQLVGMIKNGTMVEVGSYLGRSTASIVETAEKNNIKIVSVDLWELNAKLFESYGSRVPKLKEFRKNVPSAKIIQLESLTAAQCFRPKSLSGVFLDADHSYEAVKADIEAWLPLIKNGGWIAGHDYCFGWRGVKKAVKECFGRDYKRLKDTIWYHQL